jgi:hypothetical protein
MAEVGVGVDIIVLVEVGEMGEVDYQTLVQEMVEWE